MTSNALTPKVPADLVPAGSEASLPPITLTGGLDKEELDALVAGRLYVLTSFSPPSRFALWANLLRTAIAAGRTCHMLIKTDPAEFLERLQDAGWSGAQQAWLDEALRLYHMADTFPKILFRLDVDGLTAELTHWGVLEQHLLLVDAADELLSLHDLSLATPQTVKLKAWARSMRVSLLLNFNLAGSPTVKNGLAGLMDHFSGLARLRAEAEGPVLILEYWQSPTGSVAERGLALELADNGCRLRPTQPAVRKRQRDQNAAHHQNTESAGAASNYPSLPNYASPSPSPSPAPKAMMPDCFTVDQVWARELRLLMGTPWNAVSSIQELRALLTPLSPSIILLRFGPDSNLADMAREVHGLRKTLGHNVHLVVAELKAVLRYAEELMLLRLGVDAIIRRDVPMERWPALLMSGQGQHSTANAHTQPDIDVESAIASATSSHARGYLQVPDFLAEVQGASQRGQVLGVPFALAVLHPTPHHGLGEIIQAAEFRRSGDILTTDGERLYVLFYACSITKGPAVLDSVFHGRLSMMIVSVEWMVSETDINQVLNQLQRRYLQQKTSANAIAKELEADNQPQYQNQNQHQSYHQSQSQNHHQQQPQPLAKPTLVRLKVQEFARADSAARTSEFIKNSYERPELTHPDTTQHEARPAAPVTPATPAVPLLNAMKEKPPIAPADMGEPPAPLASSVPASPVDEMSDKSKKLKAYRVHEVGPFSPPTLDLTGIPPIEQESEETFTAMPEVADIIRRLAHPSAGGVKKPLLRKDLGR